MNNSTALTFGEPEHGWLPVHFAYQDLHLDFDASDALNDPTEELLNALLSLNSTETKSVVWWLEPAAYIFEFKKEESKVSLTIIETENLNNAHAPQRELIIIMVDEQEIIKPMRKALKQFGSKIYEDIHWPYHLEKDKLDKL